MNDHDRFLILGICGGKGQGKTIQCQVKGSQLKHQFELTKTLIYVIHFHTLKKKYLNMILTNPDHQ